MKKIFIILIFIIPFSLFGLNKENGGDILKKSLTSSISNQKQVNKIAMKTSSNELLLARRSGGRSGGRSFSSRRRSSSRGYGGTSRSRYRRSGRGYSRGGGFFFFGGGIGSFILFLIISAIIWYIRNKRNDDRDDY